MAYYQNQGALPIFDRRAENYNMAVDSPYSPPNNGGPGNPGTANNMPSLPRFQNNKGPAPLNPQDYRGNGGINPGNMYNMIGQAQQMGRGPRPQFGGDPYNQYGYAGQSPQLGRYRPPMLEDANNLGSWYGNGPFSYDIPNSYGSSQWNQFNSRDMPFPQFGQPGMVDPYTGSVRAQQMWPQQQQMMPQQYKSPFNRPDPMRQANYLNFLQGFVQPNMGNNPTQPGAPDQPGPVA